MLDDEKSISRTVAGDLDEALNWVLANPMTLPVGVLEGERSIFDGLEYGDGPTFTVQEVSKFFNRTPHWIRWAERAEKNTLNGESVVPGRSGHPVKGIRRYSLVDIESLAHAYYQNEAISGDQLRKALVGVWAMAEIWDYEVKY